MYSLTKKSKGNILLYQTEDGQTKIEVTLTNDTVWLTTDLMQSCSTQQVHHSKVHKECV